MIWVDRLVKQLENETLHIDDMFTPSGYPHTGSLRGPILHDVVYRVFSEKNPQTVFTYVFNDFDTIDGLPPELHEKFLPYFGFPLRLAPSPDKKFKSFAEFFTNDFKVVLEKLGVKAQYLSSWDMYHEGKFNDVIRTVLDNRDQILKVYRDVAEYKSKDDTWYPFQVICPKCSKLATTKVIGWDGEKVKFTCTKGVVGWAQGCGYEGTMSPFDGNGKLPWKVDWPAHWKVLGVNFEGAGKDHASRGSSYDIAFALMEQVFKAPKPYYFPYEFFLLGGKKMSSSKGIGLKARDITSLFPAEVARFLIVRTAPQIAIEVDPQMPDTIPNLFDEYDRCVNAYYDQKEGIIPQGKPGEVLLDHARIAQLSQVKPLPEKRLFLPRFRTVVSILKNKSANILATFEKQKGTPLTDEEKMILEERTVYGQVYLKDYANAKTENGKQESEKDVKITTKQTEFLHSLANNLKSKQPKNADETQEIVFSTLKETNQKPRDVFPAFYQAMIGKTFGPKAADIIMDLGIEKAISLLEQNQTIKTETKTTQKQLFADLNDPQLFSIDEKVKSQFPSINIGIATIKNVTITSTSDELKQKIDQFVTSQSHLTNEVLGTYPEIQSYRKLYKEMGIDWHSRRPSPEALLRRIALKKGLYSVNSCVDAYNMVVMNNRVSVGAFDLDKINLPTFLQFPTADDEILLLGDKESTHYKPSELAYFDKSGGYNIDFNYRDAQRTSVNENTKNILINIDGIYDISREQVEKTLQETLDIITKYCGGTVETVGIVSASP